MNRLVKRISVMLAAVLLVTSVPMDTYAAVALAAAETETKESAKETAENEKGMEDDSVSDEVSDGKGSLENQKDDVDSPENDETETENPDSNEEISGDLDEDYLDETDILQDGLEVENVSLTAAGPQTAAGELTIASDTVSAQNQEEGWSYDAETKKLTLDGASLKRIIVKTDVTIYVKSDSEIKTNQYSPLYVDAGASNVIITGENGATLSVISDQIYYDALSDNDTNENTITISGNIVVDCQTDFGSHYAVSINKGTLNVIEGATLKASSLQKNAIYSKGDININSGAQVYAYTEAKYPVIQLYEAAHLTVSGENTVLTTDENNQKSPKGSIAASGTEAGLTVENHASLIMKNCDKEYAPIRFDNSSVALKNARVEIRTGSESDKFESGNYLLYTGSGKFTYTAELVGAVVEQGSYDKLKLTAATSCWKYIGSKPFLQFATEPSEKTTVKKGDNINLSAQAELKESPETPNITYQWYLDDQAVTGATAATINHSTAELKLGVHTLYCKAQMNTSEVGIIEKDSEKATVYVTSDGRSPRTTELTLSIQDTCTNEEEGWSWNSDTKTLTLNNFVQYVEDENKYGINLPANSTLILQGENIIQTKKMSPVYVQGNLMMYGSGNATLYSQVPQDSYKHLGVGTTGILNLYADIKKGAADGTSGVKQVWDTDEGLYVTRIESSNSPILYIENKPEKNTFTASVEGTAPEIEIGAKLINTAEGTITEYEYQWYVTDDWSDPTTDSQPVTGAASAKLTAPINERGGKYYYCKVTATNNGSQYSVISDVYCVVVGAKGKKPVTEKQELNLGSIDKSEYGWKYTVSDDPTVSTLTLDNVEVFIPFATASGESKTAFDIAGRTKLKIVLADGSINNISSTCGAFWLTGETVDELNIKGKGTLNYENGVSTYGMIYVPANGVGSMKVSDGAVVNELSGSTDFKNNDNIVISNATYRLRNRGTTINSITVENGGKLYTSSTNALKAKNITVAKGGEMEVDGLNASSYAVCIDDIDGELSVGGTLLITSKNKNLLGMKYSALKDSASRIKLTDNTKLLSPDGCEVSDLYLRTEVGYDIYGTNQKNLLIAPSTFKKTAISRAGAITGDMCVGSTVSAGSFTPSDATVAYQWQYADSANAADSFWNNINGAISSTYLIGKEEYTGKYLRVKITGTGMYTGTIYSKATSPVSTDGATMVDFIADGFSLGKYNRSETLTLSYDNDVPDEVSLRVMAEDPSAQIVIKNVTAGFTEKTDAEKTINGESGMMPVHYTGSGWNYNNIKVTITSGEITKEYNVKLCTDVKETKLILNTNSETGLILMDAEHDIDHSLLNLSGGESNDNYVAIPGHNYTLAVFMTKDGRYPTGLGCDNSYIDEKESSLDEENETRNISFTMPRGRTIKFDAGIVGYRIFAPSATADWAYDEETGYYINVQWTNDHSITADAGYDNRMCAELTDQDGNKVLLKSKSENNPEGFYTYSNQNGDDVGTIFRVDKAGNKVSLDPTKSYTLKLWYGAADIEKCDVKEIKLNSPALNMSRHKIVIEKPSGTDTIVNVEMNENAKTFKVEQYPAEAESGVKVEPNGNKVKVTVKPAATVGNVYAMVYQRVPAGETIGDILTIQVVSPEEDVYVGLGEIAGTLDIYKDTDLIIPINTTNTVANIVSASFVESSKPLLSDKYTIEIDNSDIDGETATGRALIVKPANLPSATADQVDWASLANSYKGSFKAKIKIVTQDDLSEPATKKEYITDQFYNLTIGGTAPSVKATAVKFNSFYQGEKQNIGLSSKNGKITQAVVDTSKTKGNTVACPSWIQPGTGGLDATLVNSALVNKKGSGKLYLNAVIDGYRIPAQVAVSVSAVYTEPKVKLSETTVTVPADASKFVAGKQLTLLSSDKKTDYSSLNITNIRVPNTYELGNMSSNDQKTYMASKSFTVSGYDSATGIFVLKKASAFNGTEITSGKVLLIATVNGNTNQEIRISLTIKVADASKATIKADKSSVTLNSNLDSSANGIYGVQAQYIKIIPSVSGISMAGTTWTVTDSKGKGDYLSSLSIVSVDGAVDKYSIKTNAQTTDGTYKVNFSVPGVAKPATVTVNVKGTVPTIKLGKTSVTLDRNLGYKNSAYKETTIGIALSDDTISRKNSDFSYTVINSKKVDVTGQSEMGVSFVNGGTGMKVTLGDAVKSDTYTVNITYTMPSGKEAKAKVTVKVTAKAPTIKTDKKSVTLNPDLGKNDCAYIMISLPAEYAYGASEVKVYDNKKNEVDTAITCDNASAGMLKLYALEGAVRGSTYKVKYSKPYYALGENGTVSTEISVSIPKAASNGKTAITQKIAVKGSLDVSRTKSSLQITPSYSGWNKTVSYGDSSDPQVSWKVYAYDKKGKPYNCGNASYQRQDLEGLAGLVASSESPSNLDWFISTTPGVDGMTLKLNPNSTAIQNLGAIDGFTGISFKLVYKTTFTGYEKPLTSESKFSVKNGTVKLAAAPGTVVLDKNDRFDSKVVKLKITDKDALDVNITAVSLPQGSFYDADLFYVGGGYAYVVIGWKGNSVPATAKSGRQTLSVYTGYNNKGIFNANASSAITVNVR